MAISKLILNGDVQMDVTGTTAIESDVRTGKKFTKVNGVEATGTDPGASLQSSKTATPSTSQQTILPDSGYDGLEQVVVNAMPSGSAGTPTATKGTVSNHSISVTPSVTNTTGYITGGTKTGTAVTITASELASGNKAITDNGTGIDVVGYSTVSVDVNTGVNVPVFTATWDSSWTAIQNVTCNMTFSECYNYVDGGANGGVVVYETDGTETYETAATYYVGSDTNIFFTVAQSGYSSYDIIYYSGGGITTRTPSGTKVTPGTPTASKGAASNHSITVTPSVTNPMGYIDGGTITGTGVTVSASELASGNKAITANGTGIDVVGYSTVSVAVPKKYTATLGSTSYGSYSRCYIMYGTTRYYQPNQTFEFTAGDTITCVLTGEEQQYSKSQKIIVNGVVVAQDVYSTSYTYTLQTKDVKIDLVYGDNGSITISEAVIPSGTSNITSNGTYDVTNYASANVSVAKTYTATVHGTGDASDCYITYPSSGGTKYYTDGDTFEFTESSKLYCYVYYRSPSAAVYISVNGETVAGGTGVVASYTYTLPAKNISIQLYSRDSISIMESIIPDSYVGARTYTPNTSTQTIYSAAYLTGNQTINPIPSAYIIPSGTLSITESGTYDVTNYASANVNVVAGYSLDDITMRSYPSNITGSASRVANYAYFWNGSLKTVSLPNCEYVGESAFTWCANISKVSLPACQIIYGYAFMNCSKLSDIYIPMCSIIGYSAFAGAPSSVSYSLDLPSCTLISSYAFYGNGAIREISIPLVEALSGFWTFANCTQLSSIYAPLCSTITSNVFSNCGLKSAIFPSVTSLGSGTFNNNHELETVSMPLLTVIPSTCFAQCHNLHDINFQSITGIGTGAFSACWSLSSVNAPECSYISGNAFADCSALTFVSAPKCELVWASVFARCSSLESINLQSCQSIGLAVFSSCSALLSISLPMCSIIGTQAFTACRNLSTVIIGASYSEGISGTISSSAFNSCYNLMSLYLIAPFYYQLLNSITTFTSTPISNYSGSTGAYGSIYVRESLYSYYTVTSTYWARYSSRIVSLTDAEVQNVITYGRHNP